MTEWTKKDFEIDAAKRTIKEDRDTKQYQIDSGKKEDDIEDRHFVEKAIEILSNLFKREK